MSRKAVVSQADESQDYSSHCRYRAAAIPENLNLVILYGPDLSCDIISVN